MVKQAARQLPVFALCVAVCAAVIWLLILLNVLPRSELFVALAVVVSLLMLLLFETNDRVQQAAERVSELSAGTEKLAHILAVNLGEVWTLHQNVRLPGVPPVEHLLVGEQGVFVINVINSIATHHVKAAEWHQRNEQMWVLLPYNPSKAVQTGAADVARWLADAGLAVEVHGRIAWMGSGMILQDESAVPIWEIAHQDVMIEEITAGEMTADHTEINALIKRYANV